MADDGFDFGNVNVVIISFVFFKRNRFFIKIGFNRIYDKGNRIIFRVGNIDSGVYKKIFLQNIVGYGIHIVYTNDIPVSIFPDRQRMIL